MSKPVNLTLRSIDFACRAKTKFPCFSHRGPAFGRFREKAEALGKPLPISISIGVDPAIEIASCFEPPTTPLGFNELSIAGAIRGKAVELAPV